MIRRTLCSTLLPYTTLFRSLVVLLRQREARAEHIGPEEGGVLGGQLVHLGVRGDHGLGRDARVERHRGHRDGAQLATDRKSTRLNSSHLGISYAVFCLKKKK